jgi:hypothetical protein
MSAQIPSFILKGTYQQYKEDTDYCCHYLIEKAADLGHGLAKYRKQAARTFKQSGSDGSKTKVLIKVKDWHPLAQWIVANSPQALISDTFMGRLRAALQARMVFASKHADDEDNGGHNHFNKCLQSVLDCLQPIHARQKAARRARYKKPAVEDAVEAARVNRHVTASKESVPLHNNEGREPTEQTDEPKVEEAHDIDQELPDSTSSTEIEVTFEEPVEAKEDRRLFAVHCLLIDLHRIRSWLWDKWAAYKDGNCSLIVASLATNTAIGICMGWEQEMIQALELDLESDLGVLAFLVNRERYRDTDILEKTCEQHPFLKSIHPCLNNFSFMTQFTLASVFLGEKMEKLDEANRQRPSDWNRSELFYRRLSSKKLFLPVRPGSTVQRYVNKITMRDSEAIGFNPVHQQTFREAFSDSIDDFLSEKDGGDNMILNGIQDCVFTHLTDSLRNGYIQLSTAFAVCLFLDSVDILREEFMRRPLTELDATAQEVVMKVTIHTSILKTTNIAANGDFLWILIRGLAQRVLSDDTEAESKLVHVQPNLRKRLASNPILCGLYQLWLRRRFADASIHDVDDRMVVMDLAHFYNSVLVSGLLPPWTDMEHVIDLHGADHVFHGGRPSDLQNCAVKYRLLMGRKPNDDGWLHNITSYRKLREPFCPLSRMFMKRLLPTSADNKWRDITEVELAALEIKLKGSKHRIKFDVHDIVTNRSELHKHHASRRRSYNALELLEDITTIIDGETKMMCFDHLAFQRRCFGALCEIRDNLENHGFDLQLQPEEKTKFGVGKVFYKITFLTVLDYEMLKRYPVKLETASDELLMGQFVRTREGRFEAAAEGFANFLRKLQKTGAKYLKDS